MMASTCHGIWGWTHFPGGERLFLSRVPYLNPEQSKLPMVGSASSGGLAFPARDFLSHKAALQKFLGLPQPRGEAGAAGTI